MRSRDNVPVVLENEVELGSHRVASSPVLCALIPVRLGFHQFCRGDNLTIRRYEDAEEGKLSIEDHNGEESAVFCVLGIN
jgi:hypothetical protein